MGPGRSLRAGHVFLGALGSLGKGFVRSAIIVYDDAGPGPGVRILSLSYRGEAEYEKKHHPKNQGQVRHVVLLPPQTSDFNTRCLRQAYSISLSRIKLSLARSSVVLPSHSAQPRADQRMHLGANTFHERRESGPQFNRRVFLQIMDASYRDHLLVRP